MRLRARPCRVATLIPAPEPPFVVRWGSSVCSGVDRPGFCGGLVMPWWWCGFDGSGVRRRRVTGRRRWSGGVGCGCTSSPSGRLRPRGSSRSFQGPSRQNGPRACRGLLRASAAAPAQGGAHGFRPRRPVPSSTSRPAWAMDRYWLPWSLWWTRPQGSPPSRCLRAPGRLFQGAGRAPAPRARAGGPGRRCGRRAQAP